MTTTADLALQTSWEGTAGAWLAQVASRTGSKRTPDEYRRYLARFLAMVGGDPTEATTAHVHAFAYGAGPHGREPSPSTVTVRLAAISSFYDFARRMGRVATNPAADVKYPRPARRSPVAWSWRSCNASWTFSPIPWWGSGTGLSSLPPSLPAYAARRSWG